MSERPGIRVMQDFRTETFLDVCKTGSYTRTAHRLSITQPAVSQHISYLEKVYGAKLFEYRSKRLVLTEAGAVLCDALTIIAHDERLLKEQIASLAGARRTMRFGVTLTVGEYVIARPLARYLVANPDIQVKVMSSDTTRLLEALHAGELDCVFVEGFIDKSVYEWQTMRTERLVPVCARGHRFVREPGVMEDLLGEHLITREYGSGTRAVLEHALASRNLTVESFARSTEVTSLNIIKSFVACDYGIAFLYESAVRSECEEGVLECVALDEPPIEHDMTFVWLKGSLFSDGMRSFIEEVAAYGI